MMLAPTAPLTPPSSGVSSAQGGFVRVGSEIDPSEIGGLMEDNGEITTGFADWCTDCIHDRYHACPCTCHTAPLGKLLPPETTTPMPPTLVHVYDRHLGWPGRVADDPGFAPIQIKPHITVNQWPTFVKKLSDRTPTITP